MKKRIFALLLTAGLLTGCGMNTPPDANEVTKPPVVTVPAEEQIDYEWMAGESPVPNRRVGLRRQGLSSVDSGTGTYFIYRPSWRESSFPFTMDICTFFPVPESAPITAEHGRIIASCFVWILTASTGQRSMIFPSLPRNKEQILSAVRWYLGCTVKSYFLERNGLTPLNWTIHFAPSMTANSSILIRSCPAF